MEVSIYVVRALVELRELANTHQGLAKRLDALEVKTEALAMSPKPSSWGAARRRKPTTSG